MFDILDDFADPMVAEFMITKRFDLCKAEKRMI